KIEIVTIIDMRQAGADGDLTAKVKQAGIAVHLGSCIYEVVPTTDKTGVSAVVICPYDEASAEADLHQKIVLHCDGVAMSAGWAPAAALLYQAGTQMRYDQAVQQFVPNQLPDGVFAAGK